MFFDTLDITDKWVGTIYHKIDKQELQCVSLDDQRGHHVNRPNKVSDVIKQSVRIHISQIPVVDSHYVRARSAKQYFDESLTFVKSYQLYKAWLQDNQYEPEIKATERQYREVFFNEFNIDFFKPKKDLCLTCDIYKRASIEERESLQLNYTFHIASKYVVREFKMQKKLLEQGSDSVVVACYDLQKILSTPMSEVSTFYYKIKLAVYNFTIFDSGENEGECYVWDETIGKPYTVTELDQNKILNFTQLKDTFINFELHVEDNKIKWAQIKHLNIQRENPELIHVNYDVLSESMYRIDIGKKPVRKRSSARKSTNKNTNTTMTSGIPSAYSGTLAISKAKYKDLNSLCT
ncbi:hypothetical protein JTB14_018896 [Gonioctena quinquepunctata]|nr:hypothetical protein JTB14_018896 [Gonioctena quinquepunctata]